MGPLFCLLVGLRIGTAEAGEPDGPVPPGAKVVVIAHLVQWTMLEIPGTERPEGLAEATLAVVETALRDVLGYDVVPHVEYRAALARTAGCVDPAYASPLSLEPFGGSVRAWEVPDRDTRARCTRQMRREARGAGAEYGVLSFASYHRCDDEPGTVCLHSVELLLLDVSHRATPIRWGYVWRPQMPDAVPPLEGLSRVDQYRAVLDVILHRPPRLQPDPDPFDLPE